MRWLHIYLSMFSLARRSLLQRDRHHAQPPRLVLQRGREQSRGRGRDQARKWLHARDARGGRAGAADPDRQVAKLEIVEHLRNAHAIRGALADFRVDDGECVVSFKGPGYAADAFIDRESGHYRLTETYHGFIAVINDLHKGRDTGPVWSVVIDVSAVLMTFISLTGLVLLFYLKLRRIPGVIVALIGTVSSLDRACIGWACPGGSTCELGVTTWLEDARSKPGR